MELGVDARVVAERAGDSEHEVMAGFVLEEKWPRGGEEHTGIGEPLDVHRVILYYIGNA